MYWMIFLCITLVNMCIADEYLYINPISNCEKKEHERPYYKPVNVSDTSFFHMVNIPKLQQKCISPIPTWMQKRVQKELSSFQNKGISQEALNYTFKQVTNAIQNFSRYRILGHDKIYQQGNDPYDGNNTFLRTLAFFADNYNIPDLPCVDFIVYHDDGIPIEFHPKNFWITTFFENQAPLFAHSKVNDAPYIITIPDRFVIAQWWGTLNNMMDFFPKYPWEKKKLQVFWRGGPSDFRRHWWNSVPEMCEHYSHQPRFLLCKLSQKFPEVLNVGFSSTGSYPFLKDLLKPYMKESMPIGPQLQYAFLVVVDGMMPPFTGFLWPLFSNSVVFKQTSNESQWYYDALQPYEHYIPVAHDFSDLVEKYQWALQNQKRCKQIAKNAHDFVSKNLMPEDFYLYFFYLLQQYEKCQMFDVKTLEKETEQDPSWKRIR